MTKPDPVELLVEQASALSDIRKVHGRRFSLGRHAASGAMVAVLAGTLWALYYLLTVQYGRNLGQFGFAGDSLWGYVIGKSLNLNGGGDLLFIVVTRFIVAFGLLWLPATALIAAVRR
jgi:threonine/homoserine efflux transporter RhtA